MSGCDKDEVLDKIKTGEYSGVGYLNRGVPKFYEQITAPCTSASLKDMFGTVFAPDLNGVAGALRISPNWWMILAIVEGLIILVLSLAR